MLDFKAKGIIGGKKVSHLEKGRGEERCLGGFAEKPINLSIRCASAMILIECCNIWTDNSLSLKWGG